MFICYFIIIILFYFYYCRYCYCCYNYSVGLFVHNSYQFIYYLFVCQFISIFFVRLWRNSIIRVPTHDPSGHSHLHFIRETFKILPIRLSFQDLMNIMFDETFPVQKQDLPVTLKQENVIFVFEDVDAASKIVKARKTTNNGCAHPSRSGGSATSNSKGSSSSNKINETFSASKSQEKGGGGESKSKCKSKSSNQDGSAAKREVRNEVELFCIEKIQHTNAPLLCVLFGEVQTICRSTKNILCLHMPIHFWT